MPETQRETLVRKMVAEGTSDDDIRATLKTFDAQGPPKPAAAAPASAGESLTNVLRTSFGRQALGPLASVLLKDHPDIVDTVGDSVIGALKGLGHTVEGLGKVAHMIPGVTAATDAIYGRPGVSDAAFKEAERATTPTNTAQAVGKGAEQVAEFFVPSGAAEHTAAAIAGKLPAFTNAPRIVQAAAGLAPRMATEAASAAGVTAAQGGSPVGAAVMGAAGPVAGKAIDAAVPALRAAAEAGVVKALGPTKERFKAMSARLAPQILSRGLGGSREALQAQAGEMASKAADDIDAAIQAYGARPVSTQPITDAIESAKDAFRTTTATGVVEYEPRAIRQLDKLSTVVKDLGPDVRADQLIAVRRAWDKVVADAGGYAHRAPGGIGVPLKDVSEASAKLEATSAIRAQLAKAVPELSAINKEYSFWKSLDDVVTQTLQRTAPQKPGLGRLVAESAGQAAGAVAGSGGGPAGSLGGAFAMGKLAKMADALFRSPRWQLATAQAKNGLADAIVSGDATRIAYHLSRLGAGAVSAATENGRGTN